MSNTYVKLFAPTLLTGSASTIYTMPAIAGTVLKNLIVRVTNTDSSARTVTLYAVPNGDTASVTNVFFNAVSLAPGESQEVNVPTIDASDTLQGLASTTSVVNIQEAGGTLYAP